MIPSPLLLPRVTVCQVTMEAGPGTPICASRCQRLQESRSLIIPRLIATAAFAALMLAAARDADACQCMASGPPCQSFFQVQAVFAGTVRSITPTPRAPMVLENVRVEFEDTIAFRGVEGSTQTVFTASDGAACGYAFKPGERYVVYAYRSKPGEPLRTVICSRTRPIAEAAEDLLFFKNLSTATSSPRVFGSITHAEPGTPTRDGRQYGQVAKVRLTLRSDTATYQTATDTKGRYELTGVPPATYQLTVEPPPEFVSYDRPNQTIDLGDRHSCAEKNFVLHFDGRVRGSIRNSTGGPAAGVRVQLMRIEYVYSRSIVETIDATADAAGRFEFIGITPARYVLGIDLFRQAESPSDSPVVFPVTYHPGTPDAMRATIIDMRGGERHDVAPMTLPPALRAHRLTGTVWLEDGAPAAGVSVALLDAVRKWLDVAPPVETDSSGAFSFVVHEGLSYIISAVYPGRDTRGQRRVPTTVGPFAVTKEPAPLRIVVAPDR